MNDESVSIFVPGRLCVMGEHSDWAGTYRMMNAEIAPGLAIVTGIGRGITARAARADGFHFELRAAGLSAVSFDCEMETNALRENAAAGGFFSYVAGVASYLREKYGVGGLRVTVDKMDLPMKKGLSSSAAVCVLTAKAFNRLYGLGLDTEGEMHAAYRGEQRTPSRCGRMDQACAYGVNPVLMRFDGLDTVVRRLSVGAKLHWVIVDLGGQKDTVGILRELNRAYPFAGAETERRLHEALGEDNRAFVQAAAEAIEAGDAAALGSLMNRYQANFDAKVLPACPAGLASPILHSVLQDPKLQPFILGGKGVGSQGDGMAQFLTGGPEHSRRLTAYLEKKRGMHCIPFVLQP